MKSTKKHLKQDKSRQNELKSALIVLVAATICLVAMCFALKTMGFFNRLKGLTIPQGAVKIGTISDGEIESIPKGEIRYRINKDVIFDNPYCRGNIMVENPKVSEYNLVFVFCLKDAEKTEIYRSQKLRPGECIREDKLTGKGLRQGVYGCELVVEAYDIIGSYCGSTKSSVTVHINEN